MHFPGLLMRWYVFIVVETVCSQDSLTALYPSSFRTPSAQVCTWIYTMCTKHVPFLFLFYVPNFFSLLKHHFWCLEEIGQDWSQRTIGLEDPKEIISSGSFHETGSCICGQSLVFFKLNFGKLQIWSPICFGMSADGNKSFSVLQHYSL